MTSNDDGRSADTGGFVFQDDGSTASAESPKDLFERVSEQLRSRRSFMGNAAKIGGGALALSAGTGTAFAQDDGNGKAKSGGNGKAKNGGGDGGNGDGGDGDSGMGTGGGGECQRGGPSDLEILNFALLLERLEATFYEEAIGTAPIGESGGGGAFTESDIENSAPARQFAGGDLRYGAYQKFKQIRDHERTHVEALVGAIEAVGGEPVGNPGFTFPYETVEEFVGLARVFEDTGAAAYAGAAPFISSAEYLEVAGQILAVEARHASYIRAFGTSSLTPFPNAFQPTMSMAEVTEAVTPFIDNGGGDGGDDTQMFTVTVENVSTPGTIDSERAGGAVPLSPPVYGVYSGDNPAFAVGESANEGTEIVAEDGFPMALAEMLANAENVSASGAAPSPGGSLPTPALGPGESVEFSVSAAPGDHFTMETMFVQPNDWFYGFEGLALFEDGEAISGDVTGSIAVYDAGTEADTAPGTGPDQKPAQGPEAMDVGPKEDEPIQLASERHPDFTIPADEDVIRVTVTPQ